MQLFRSFVYTLFLFAWTFFYAIFFVIACSFLPFHNAEAVERTIRAVEEVTRKIRCYDLWFAPDPSIIDALTHLIFGRSGR